MREDERAAGRSGVLDLTFTGFAVSYARAFGDEDV